MKGNSFALTCDTYKHQYGDEFECDSGSRDDSDMQTISGLLVTAQHVRYQLVCVSIQAHTQTKWFYIETNKMTARLIFVASCFRAFALLALHLCVLVTDKPVREVHAHVCGSCPLL